jgi:hypothetical protein
VTNVTFGSENTYKKKRVRSWSTSSVIWTRVIFIQLQM